MCAWLIGPLAGHCPTPEGECRAQANHHDASASVRRTCTQNIFVVYILSPAAYRTDQFMQLTGTSRPQPQSLPPELLLQIFKATRSPRFQHDPTAMGTLWLSELRLRKDLALVCKEWSGPATEVLYEDIVLRRMGQISALARTLALTASETGRNLAGLIKTVRFDSCVVLWPFEDVIREDLCAILQRCGALHTLEFHVHRKFPTLSSPPAPGLGNNREGFNPDWLVRDHTTAVGRALGERLSTTLKVLDLSLPLPDPSTVLHLHHLLSGALHLTVLKLGRVSDVSEVNYYEVDAQSLPVSKLPRLEQLYMHITNPTFCDYVCEKWSMPSLTHLTTLCSTYVPLKLLEAHGTRLKYLHICPERQSDWPASGEWKRVGLDGVERIPKLCPVLEHLVVPKKTREAVLFEFFLVSPSIRYIDVWSYPIRLAHIPIGGPADRFIKNSDLPALITLRHIGTKIRVDLPLICHPKAAEHLAEKDGLMWYFPGMCFVQTSEAIVPDIEYFAEHGKYRAEYLPPALDVGDEDDSADWVPDAESEPDYEMASEDERISEHATDYWEPEEQLDRDAVLEMFRSSQEVNYVAVESETSSDDDEEPEDGSMSEAPTPDVLEEAVEEEIPTETA
ncbi:hypothetical protein BD413DRAFT_111314 [Trametes elegans]|nr:hypothetical protein BD413DRAFT_111314 [Trametes elegans]